MRQRISHVCGKPFNSFWLHVGPAERAASQVSRFWIGGALGRFLSLPEKQTGDRLLRVPPPRTPPTILKIRWSLKAVCPPCVSPRTCAPTGCSISRRQKRVGAGRGEDRTDEATQEKEEERQRRGQWKTGRQSCTRTYR